MAIFLCLMMLGISFFDFRSYLIPDLFHGFLIFGRIAVSASWQEIGIACLNGSSVALPLYLLCRIMKQIMHQECMGGGDIKLMFSLGLYFDPYQILLALMLACATGLILSLFYLKKQKYLIPFGPCICLGFFIVMLLEGRMFK